MSPPAASTASAKPPALTTPALARIGIGLTAPAPGEAWNDASPLAAHFGQARSFAILDCASGVIVDHCEIAGYCAGPCHCPLPNLVDAKVDALLGQTLGFRQMQQARRKHIPVLAVTSPTLGALRQLLRAPQPLTLGVATAKCLGQRGQPPFHHPPKDTLL